MGKNTLLFYTTDIHGSERCFRKFLNAAKFYRAQVIIMGGDITGKLIVPLVHHGNGTYTCEYMGLQHHLETGQELANFEQQVRNFGHYPYRTTADEVDSYDTQDKVEGLFLKVIRESMVRWVELAEERLQGLGIRCFLSPGNDDTPVIDDVISASSVVQNPDGRVVWLDDVHEMVSCGYSNPTPWESLREASEDDLLERVDAMFRQTVAPQQAVANCHVPPYDTGIDSAPQLKDFKVQTTGGQAVFVPVGSTAVREALRRYQPLLGLHGHIHESRGIAKVGKTICINPGSEYTEGVLAGALVTLNKKGIDSYQLVTG